MNKALIDYLDSDWLMYLEAAWATESFDQLGTFIETIYHQREGTVFPVKPENIFRALNTCPLEQVKVVISGQDPYCQSPDQANGLAFSVPSELKILPPSLVNIYQELASDLRWKEIPKHGDLSSWAAQGVLLLNTVLTVDMGRANSHCGKGWEDFTDEVLRVINRYRKNVVFLLWGLSAKQKRKFIDEQKHLVLTCGHPSPKSSHLFFNRKHFSQTNHYLSQHHQVPIQWDSKQMMTWEHSFSYSDLSVLQENKKLTTPKFELGAADIWLEIELSTDDVNYFAVWVRLTVPKGYSSIKTDIKIGIVNKNNNLCAVKLVKDATYDTKASSWGYSKFIDRSKLARYQMENKQSGNVIKFRFLVLNYEYKHNEPRMIQAIYEKLFQEDDHYALKYHKSLEQLIKRCSELEHDNQIFRESLQNNQAVEKKENVEKKLTLAQFVDQCRLNELPMDELKQMQQILHKFLMDVTDTIRGFEKCILCADNSINCVFVPCGHQKTCVSCAQKCNLTCPYCRATIEKIVPTF